MYCNKEKTYAHLSNISQATTDDGSKIRIQVTKNGDNISAIPSRYLKEFNTKAQRLLLERKSVSEEVKEFVDAHLDEVTPYLKIIKMK